LFSVVGWFLPAFRPGSLLALFAWNYEDCWLGVAVLISPRDCFGTMTLGVPD
jgi:hypothetical protein